MRVVISTQPFNEQAELESFAKTRPGNAGAFASFVGYCRDVSIEGRVDSLHLDHYPGYTEAEVERLARTTFERHHLLDLLVMHRAGTVSPRDPIVLVAALASHRAEALDAVAELMDYLKTDAPFWKRETGDRGSRWIEPTAADRARRADRGD